MKKLILVTIISILIFSCKRENNIPVAGTITSGTWSISKYIDSGSDETNHFTGYTFNFNSDGSLVALTNGNGVVGNWSEYNDDDHTELNILFSQDPLVELNDDWHVKSKSDTKIELEDISGGNGEIDYLTFIKQ